MDSMTLFIASLAVSCIGALASVLLIKADNAAKTAGCLIGAVAAVLSFIAGLEAVLGDVSSLNTVFFFPFARLELLLNGLAGLIVVLISILAFAGFIYGLSYFDEYPGKVGRAGFFMNTFVASMMLVITADNVFWFLVAFELMSLTSYFLVVIEENKNSIRGGWLYFVIAHVGFVLIMASFLLMTNGVGGSFSFSDFRTHDFGPAVSSACFVLAFFGFGAKAGIIPLHSWLPQAHPEAPSNVSALMSGGMIKIGILGILKVGLDLLAGSGVQLWWGLMVLVFGSISSVLGVVYALHEHDIKRLLAYHSVENIGIILLGVGASMTAHALGNDVIATIALMAALYHTLNHAMFKGELFLGAGSLLYATGTRNMEKMGGLFRRMPVTAVCFLIGALAISAIPPLNGFVSEWFTYQSLFNISTLSDPVVMVFAVASAAALAITGALAVTCFVKAYGVSFASSPRSQEAANAKESPAPMLFSQMLLAAICVVLGIGSPVIAPVLGDVAQSVLAGSAITATSGVSLVNEISGAATSTPAIAIALVVLTGLARVIRAKMHNRRGPSILQDYRDLAKLMARPESVSSDSSFVLRIMPPLFLAVSFMLAMGLPMFTLESPMPVFGDAITIMYALALSRFFFALSGVDSSNAYAGFGGIRELLMSVLIEPSMLIALFTVAIVCGSTDIATMGQHIVTGNVSSVVAVILAGVAFAAACYMELGKLPFDQAEAEQELQEGPLAELSGPSLAMMKLAMGMKQVVVVAWFTSIFIPWGEPATIGVTALVGAVVFLVKCLVDFVVCGVLENSVSRSRFKVLGNQTWAVVGIAVLAFVFVVVGV